MLDQAKHIYNLGGGKRSFGNVNLPMNLPSASLPKEAQKGTGGIKPSMPKSEQSSKQKS
jgi:hypothetical protein